MPASCTEDSESSPAALSSDAAPSLAQPASETVITVRSAAVMRERFMGLGALPVLCACDRRVATSERNKAQGPPIIPVSPDDGPGERLSRPCLRAPARFGCGPRPRPRGRGSVSYTHLTLPTI